MNDTITQTRLSLRLDAYLSDYMGKYLRKDQVYREEWNMVWNAAEVARTNNTLTPELVDDVRVALNKY